MFRGVLQRHAKSAVVAASALSGFGVVSGGDFKKSIHIILEENVYYE